MYDDCIPAHVSAYVSCVCVSGYVYVDLHSEEQVEKALKKNKDYIGEKYSILFLFLGIIFECM